MHRFGLMVMFCFAWMPGPLMAATAWPIDEIAVFEGVVDAETSIDQVVDPNNAGRFRVLQQDFSAGYRRHPSWFRITLTPPPPDAFGQRSVLLVAKPDFTQSLMLYRPQTDGFSLMATGALVPFSERPYPHRNLIFPLNFDDAQPVTLYLRLKTASSSFLDLEAWRPNDHQQSVVGELLLTGLYVGLILAGLIGTLGSREWFRDRLQQSFLVFLLVMLVHFLGTNGLTVQYLFPNHPRYAWLLVAFGSYAVSASLIWLLLRSFSMHHASPWLHRAFQVVLWAAILMSPAPLLGLHPEASRILVWLGTLTLSLGTLWSIHLMSRGEAGSFPLLLANLCPLIGALLTSLTLLGVLPGSMWLFSAFQVGLLGSLVAFQILLSQRRKWFESAYEESRQRIQQAEQKAAWEQSRAEEQQQFMSMLTHELKTPLALIRLRLDAPQASPSLSAHAEQAVRDIDAIIDRCAIASRISAGERFLTVEPCAMSDLVESALSMLPVVVGVHLEQHVEEQDTLIEGDALLIRTALLNLLDNAFKYAATGSTVVLRIKPRQCEDQAGVQVLVCNWVGVVGAPDPARVFDKYYRAPGASRVSGSGLGLYIVERFVVAMGGRIRCEIHPGEKQKVCFDLWLPRQPTRA